MRWTVLVPVKALPDGKARLQGATPDAAAHAQLVAAIRADTIASVRRAAAAARVVLVSDRPVEGDLVFVQTAPGLNAALAEAAADAISRWPADGVAALVGDLPALRPADLDAGLNAAAAHPRAFVRDSAGSGTTMLTALPGTALRPEFGQGSARRHEASAVELPAAAGLRADVDTAADLAAAVALGVGPLTRTAVTASRERGARGIMNP